MRLAGGLQAICSALFLLLTFFAPHKAWLFYLVLILFGAARGFAGPSGQSLLPFLVERERLPRAISITSSAFTAAVIAGPALGGFLYALGPAAVYGLCIAGFAVCGFDCLTPGRAALHAGSHAGDRLRARRRRRALRALTARCCWARFRWIFLPCCWAGATALLPVYARDILHVGPIGLGILRSAPAAGAFSVAFALTRCQIKGQVGAKMFAAVAIFGLATIVFGLST